MKTIDVQLGERSYPIYIGRGLLSNASILDSHLNTSQVLVVSNEVVAPLYLENLVKTINAASVETLVLPDGEQTKSLQYLDTIITRLMESKFSRTCVLIALGGGVIGDLTGFAAACYQRGVRFIQVPTTLLAQVDSSVGGKTAVNHPLGKNMIGAFYQPAAVLADTGILETLPQRELSAGLAEVIKYGLIRDKEFYQWLKDNMDALMNRDEQALAYAIERSCLNKAEVVSADERESGIRAILNLGHTFGHAIETALSYKEWLHGEAVGCGMLLAADLSCHMGFLTEDDVQDLKQLLLKAHLPVKIHADVSLEQMLQNMKVDKKARDGVLFLVLLEAIGKATVTSSFDADALANTIQKYLT